MNESVPNRFTVTNQITYVVTLPIFKTEGLIPL